MSNVKVRPGLIEGKRIMEVDVEEWLKGKGEVFLRDIGVKEGQVVLDFGCNVGHYTIPAAKVVGERGKVYAVDSQIKSLDELMRTAAAEGLKNIVPIHSQATNLQVALKDESVDVVLLYDVLHYMDVAERNRIYDESYRVLKVNALLSVYPKHSKLDEPLWNLSNMRLEDLIREIEGARFHFEGKLHRRLIHDNNCNKGYVLSFSKRKKIR